VTPSTERPERKATFLRIAARPAAIGIPIGTLLGGFVGFISRDNFAGGAIAGAAFGVFVVAFLVGTDIRAGALGAPGRWPFQSGDEFMGWELAGRLGTRADHTVGYDVRRDGERAVLTVLSTKHSKEQVAVRRDQHPLEPVKSRHVVAPMDTGVVGDYAYVIVPMDRAEPLAALVERTGPLGGEALYRLAIGAARAVRDAHAQAVVLGRLRPDQVACDGDRAALYGFDPLARFRDDEGYLAPEQVLDPDAVATTRSDVFSLASTMCFAATGRHPRAVDTGRVMQGSAEQEWPVAGDWLRPIIADALADDPGRRPAAEEIVERLSRVGAEHDWQPAPAVAHSSGLTRPSSPGRLAVAVAATVVLAAVLPVLVPQGDAVATRPAVTSAPPADVATTTAGPSTVGTIGESVTTTTAVAATGGTRGTGWPTEADDGSPDLRAYLGAAFIVPDWISCAGGYCLVGSGDQVTMFTENPIDQVDQTTLDKKDPRGALVGFGLRPEQADALLAR